MELPFLKDWDSFSMEDPFNGNLVEGLLCYRTNDFYGSLYIERVNHKECKQLIMCTPKIKYPFDIQGNWHFPKAVRIERYVKLDGTNIFAYKYTDGEKDFVSYKVRIAPFMQDSKWGPFLSYWKEMIEKKPFIRQLTMNGTNASYELWGAKNKHLIEYDTPLESSLLFVRKSGKVVPPSQIDFPETSKTRMTGIVDREYVKSYQDSQAALENGLVAVEDRFRGTEGEVWYILDEAGGWTPYKCKPETIEQIHWSAGGINKNVVTATCQNAFESWDDPTVENVIQLLKEEFDERVINVDIVEFCLKKVKKEIEFRDMVLAEYQKIGVNILEDKRTVMRALSSKFKREEMKKIYSAIITHTIG